jgi:lysozyme family protein
MNLSFEALRPEITALLASMKVTKPGLDTLVDHLISIKARYVEVEQATGVPAAWLLAVDYREGDNNPRTHFANGDPLDRMTSHVPKGLGPFTGPNAWRDGCIAGLRRDHIDRVPGPWTAPLACYEAEAWNGFGPREHGVHTGYVWAGTNIYAGGGYPSDRVWSSSWHDDRFGVAPIMLELGRRDPSLALPGWPAAAGDAPIPAPTPVGTHRTAGLQAALNALGFGPITVDGSLGRQTRQALKAFQRSQHLKPDGVAGPATQAALGKALAAARPTGPSVPGTAAASVPTASPPPAGAVAPQSAFTRFLAGLRHALGGPS